MALTEDARALPTHLYGHSEPALLLAQRPANALSLLDGGATHIIHPNDYGAIPGTWRDDAPRLRLGDKTYMETYGSVEKLFTLSSDPDGPPLRRRVLVAPRVMGLVWSHHQEVDVHKSTIVDSPDSCYILLQDGRRLTATRSENGLRWLEFITLPSERSFAVQIASAVTPLTTSPDRHIPALQSLVTSYEGSSHDLALSQSDDSLLFLTGVGKAKISLTDIQLLHLWHARLGHPSWETLVTSLAALKVLERKLSPSAIRAFAETPCDICNAFKQRTQPVNRNPRRPWTLEQRAAIAPPPSRALKPLRRVLCDVFGPVAILSAEYNYRYLIGFWDEATGYRWVFGSKEHTAEVMEEIMQLLRASLRLVLGDIEILRTDNASEFAKAARWAEYLADSMIFPEYSVPYDARAMGGVERGWGVHVPTAGALLAQFGGGKRHWFTASYQAFLLGNIRSSDIVTIDGKRQNTSAHFRLYQVEYQAKRLRCYGAPVRYVTDASIRDGKFDEHARAGHYVGVSPSNSSAMLVFDGYRHVTVTGASVVDETRFISATYLDADRLSHWPYPDIDDALAPAAVVPAADRPRLNPPHPMRVQHDPLPNGTVLKFRFQHHSKIDWEWHECTVIGFEFTESSKRTKHIIEWHEKRPYWTPIEPIDLQHPTRVWDVVSLPPVDNPDSTRTPATPLDLAAIRPTRTVTMRARDAASSRENTSQDSPPTSSTSASPPSAATPPTGGSATGGSPASPPSAAPPAASPPTGGSTRVTRSRSSLGHSLRQRAVAVLALAAALDVPTPSPGLLQQAHELQRMPAELLEEAAVLGDMSDLEHDPIDVVPTPENPTFVTDDDRPTVTVDLERSDQAAQLAVACAHGTSAWTPLDDSSIHDLRKAGEVYVFSLDEYSTHPALLAAKARVTTASRKTVVYHDPDGVVHAIEPKSVKEALNSLQHDQWVTAINVELENLRTHGAYHLVPKSEPLSQGKKIMNMTFVFKVKVKEDLSLDKFKARLCVVGSSMVQGSDYEEKYASCARTSSIKLVTIVTITAGWIDFQFDLHGAFLTADIDSDVYCHQPSGVEHERGPNGEPMVWKLDKAIYGTVQAARLFSTKLRTALLAIGFTVSVDDDNVYRLDHKLGRVILTTHIDDGIGGASTQEVLDYFLKRLTEHGFSYSAPPGRWDTILGFGAERDLAKRTLTLTARKQIASLVEEHLATEGGETHPRTVDTDDIMKLEPPPPDETEEQAAAHEPMRKLTRSLLGALIYVAQIHPAISHPVSRACAFMAKPTPLVYTCAKRILLWLRDRIDTGVVYGDPNIRCLEDLIPKGEPRQPMDPHRDFSLGASVDSDLNSRCLLPSTAQRTSPPDHASSRSQMGYEFHLAGGTFVAVSQRQHSVALDTAAAELFAASAAAAQLINITGVLRFISFGILGVHPVPLWCDNEACCMVARDASSVKRLAYVARRVRLLQELEARRIIRILDVDGKVNPADMLTKHLDKPTWLRYVSRMYNQDLSIVPASVAQPRPQKGGV